MSWATVLRQFRQQQDMARSPGAPPRSTTCCATSCRAHSGSSDHLSSTHAMPTIVGPRLLSSLAHSKVLLSPEGDPRGRTPPLPEVNLDSSVIILGVGRGSPQLSPIRCSAAPLSRRDLPQRGAADPRNPRGSWTQGTSTLSSVAPRVIGVLGVGGRRTHVHLSFSGGPGSWPIASGTGTAMEVPVVSTEDPQNHRKGSSMDVVSDSSLRERLRQLLRDADLQTTTGACETAEEGNETDGSMGTPKLIETHTPTSNAGRRRNRRSARDPKATRVGVRRGTLRPESIDPRRSGRLPRTGAAGKQRRSSR